MFGWLLICGWTHFQFLQSLLHLVFLPFSCFLDTQYREQRSGILTTFGAYSCRFSWFGYLYSSLFVIPQKTASFSFIASVEYFDFSCLQRVMMHHTFPQLSLVLNNEDRQEHFLPAMTFVSIHWSCVKNTFNFFITFQRPLNAPTRRSSPPSGVTRRSTDSYMPPRSEYPYRDGLSNVYRPNNYRPDYSSSYYSRSPSPDSYGHRSRLPEPEVWDRGSSWRPPPLTEAPNSWAERKSIPPSPTTSSRGRGPREDSNRMFEPSDSWKQSHNDRPPRIDQYVHGIKHPP